MFRKMKRSLSRIEVGEGVGRRRRTPLLSQPCRPNRLWLRRRLNSLRCLKIWHRGWYWGSHSSVSSDFCSRLRNWQKPQWILRKSKVRGANQLLLPFLIRLTARQRIYTTKAWRSTIIIEKIWNLIVSMKCASSASRPTSWEPCLKVSRKSFSEIIVKVDNYRTGRRTADVQS